MNAKFLWILLTLITINAGASIVGIVDSGFDANHDLLQGKHWVNPGESAGNRIDDDQNGLVDDLMGWNFAENSKFLFDPTQVAGIRPLTYQIIRISSKMMAGTATQEDKDFIQTEVIDLPLAEKQALIEEINFYGQHAHGTHVAGIVAQENPNTQLMNLRFFPSSVSPYAADPGFMDKIEDYAFAALADMTTSLFNQVVSYVGTANANIVNMSLGIPMERFAGFLLGIKGEKKPTTEQLAVESQKIYKHFEQRALNWENIAPNTLFVVAAGNSGIDNDLIPGFPANVNIPNIISVGATIGVSSFPEFSNYGKTTVDVAAPGVDILSSAPGPTNDFQIEMTGTSMAAPYVAGVASLLSDANSKLNAVELKKILMETVDKKDWLADKVVTSGIINSERAQFAARKSLTRSLDIAIAESLQAVADQVETRSFNDFGLRSLDQQTRDFLGQLVF